MPKDMATGLVEPDIIVNGRALTFAESMSVRVAVGSFRLSLRDQEMREGLGQLADNYDHHLAAVERTMLAAIAKAEGHESDPTPILAQLLASLEAQAKGRP